MRNIYKSENSLLQINIFSCQQQTNSVACGIYTVPNAFYIFSEADVLKIKIDENRIRAQSSLLTLNSFTLFSCFSVVDFKQSNVSWENYQTFYSFDICFNVSTKGRQDLTRSNVGSSNFSLVLHAQ